ncbi:SH3 domain-containing protein [Adhaeribacter soli]|uniref:SH3 domain-containing protein n=1 Tax=Adhaeribacter soli TaxID=2607655 RepID=A0A5N1IX67_9BACT|nr:SH3 domain-containing protein [Adhaeribacter soli]KAA9332663.1 SH3 domain-containing protein [Adhaeribacter soli]
MQNYLSKICLFFFASFLCFLQPVYSQKFTNSLTEADSLYNQKEYLKSLAIYKEILKNGQEYSPQMLLKMAYIEEALRHYDQSMYYLSLYYHLHPNRAVLRKMEEVAHTQGLKGYEYSDLDFFRTQFRKYYMNILELLLIGAVGVVTVMVLKRKQAFFRQPAFRLLFLLYLGFILYYINLLTFRQQGITHKQQAALMSGPAAGSQWLATLTKGNRLTITGENDIWFEVKWQGERAYIRKKNLLLLPE